MTDFNIPPHFIINVCKQALEDHTPAYACNSRPCSSQWWDKKQAAEDIVDKLMGYNDDEEWDAEQFRRYQKMTSATAARLLDKEPRELGVENIAPYDFDGTGFVKPNELDRDMWTVEICYTLGMTCVFCDKELFWGAGYGVDIDGNATLYYN